MKYFILVTILWMQYNIGFGQKTVITSLPIGASTKLTSLITNVNTSFIESVKQGELGISTAQSKLYINFRKKSSRIIFEVPNGSKLLTTGVETKIISKNSVAWKFDAKKENQYKLYIASASDSAQNYTLYSGYIFFPTLNKWKLIACFRINSSTENINSATIFKTSTVTTKLEDLFIDTWGQNDNGAWLKIQNTGNQKPLLPPFSDIDSTTRAQKDSFIIQKAIRNNQTDASNYKNGLYFTLMKTSTKTQVVQITDTVSIFYKGYIMGTDILFDQTDKEARTFPLGRLIKGWQIGLEGTHVGDKVKLLIPSGVAYSIRTRSPTIPPNSILVFEIETINAKPK